MNSNADEPAMPCNTVSKSLPVADEVGGSYHRETWRFHTKLGLTKREYFAAMAMQGILADPSLEVGCRETTPEGIKAERLRFAHNIAAGAILFADALLAELAKGSADAKEN